MNVVDSSAWQQLGLEAAVRATSGMQSGRVIGLDAALAREAGRIGVEPKLALADPDFERFPRVKFRPKRK